MNKDLQILMLEDVPADAELIDSALRRGGLSFQAKRVDTREEFLREIEGRPPDVILSDHGLPSFDGFAALSITREKCPDTPFIFVTGSMGEEVAVDSWRHGATDYVLKTQLSNLAPAVQRALHLSADRRKREQAEKEQHESEERFYHLVGGMKDHAFFMLDRDGRVSSWNAGTGRITGFQTSEILGRPFGCCYRPEDREVGRPNHDLKIAEAEGRFEEEGWRVRHDGSRFWAHVVITALRDKNGDLSGFSQVIHDVTERRQAQEALRKSEESHRYLVKLCPEALLVLKNGRIILANAAAQKLLGAARYEQLIGRRASDFIPAPGRGDFDHRLRALEETGTAAAAESNQETLVQDDSSLFTEETFVRLDHQPVAVEVAAARINFHEEPAVQLLVHNLTEQKEKTGATLREKEAAKAAVLNASMDAILCLDHEAKIIEWNPAAEIMFGFGRAEALGRCLDSLIVPPALPEKYPPGLAEYLATGTGRLDGHRIGLVARHASGREFPAVLAITRNPQSEPPVFTCFIHDVTPRQRIEAALRQSEERLRLQSAECDQRVQDHLTELHTTYGALELYASSLSSEPRTPLGHFESLVEILQNDAGRHMDEKSRHHLRTICESLGQAGRMIGDLLAFSPGNHAGLHHVRVNLVEVIKDILRDLWSELENRQTVRCRCELPGGDGGTPSLLRHALYNLIAHALAGQPAQSENGRLRSNGTGSSMKNLAWLLGDFKRSCPVLESGGNGAEATDNANLQEEATELSKLEEELNRREQSLKEASAALKIREEFIEQSETVLLKKIEAQQERESEIEQRQEDLLRMLTRVGSPNDEIMEPVALS